MKDLENIYDDNYDYGPNDLADLSIQNPDKYHRIVSQNIPEDMTVHEWEQHNLEFMQRHLK